MEARLLSRLLPAAVALHSKLPFSSPHLRFHALAAHLESASVFVRRGTGRDDLLSISRGFRWKIDKTAVAAAASRREYRKVRSRRVNATKKKKEKELELSVKLCLEEQLPEDPEILVFHICSFYVHTP